MSSSIKNLLFVFLTILLVIFVSGLIFISPYVYKKLTLSYSYCNSFGELDPSVGWKLKKNVKSCISLKNYISREVFFDTEVYTNKAGFRDSNENNNISKNAIVAFGDSHTFGYGVNYEDTWPSQLSNKINIDINNIGVPGYSVLSSYLLFKQNIKNLNPKIAIFFNMGSSSRAFCPKKDWHKQLIPCYYFNENKNIDIILPDKDYYYNSIKKGKYPGAYLSAGYNFYTYLFFLKPKDFFFRYLDYLKNIFNKNIEKEQVSKCKYAEDCGTYRQSVFLYEFELFYNLAQNNDFTLIFIDVSGQHKNAKDLILGNNYNFWSDENHKSYFTKDDNFIYLGKEFWVKVGTEIGKKDYWEVRVAKDGHFNAIAYEIIAEQIKIFMQKIDLI